jgi:hypothetical protein
MKYVASVRNKDTNKLEVITREDYSSKKSFEADLKRNGYKIRFISTEDKFDEDCDKYNSKLESAKAARKAISKSKPKVIRVILKAFTGMVIGEFTATSSGTLYYVTTKKGLLVFDSSFVQTNSKNPRFANKIELL